MSTTRPQPLEVSRDEERLLIFFRSITPAQQSRLLITAGKQAVRNCLPDFNLYDFMPDVGGIEPERGEDWGDSPESAMFQIISNGIEETGDPEHYLLGTDAFDDAETIPRFLHGIRHIDERQGFSQSFKFDEAFVREYIGEWRTSIARMCHWVITRMARSIAEAESQKTLTIPESAEDWIPFVLTLDGERIADELDRHPPGRFDNDLLGTLESLEDEVKDVLPNNAPEISPVLLVRLALYEKLRFLQEREMLPASGEELMNIQRVLDWLRDRIDQNKGVAND